MVRPVARYRPAARRGGQLEPVYVAIEGSGATQLIKVYRGSVGLVTEFEPFNYNPPTIVNNTDGGMVDQMTNYWSGLPDGRVDGSEWTGSVTVESRLFTDMIVDSVLYLTLVRGSYVLGRALVGWTVLNPFGGTLATGIDESPGTSRSAATAANYDMVTIAVDLDTGVIGAKKADLYSYSFQTSGYVDGAGFRYDDKTNYVGLQQAFYETLPEAHPFKQCGLTPWQFLANGPLPIGTTLFNTGSNYESPPFARSFIAYMPDAELGEMTILAAFAVRGSDLRRDTIPLGYSTSNKRVVSFGNVLELSSVDTPPAGRECLSYAYLNSFGPQSFKDYSPASITRREDILDFSGFSQADQDLLSQEPSFPPPSSIEITSALNIIETSDPVYFLGTTARPSYPNTSARVLYLIND